MQGNARTFFHDFPDTPDLLVSASIPTKRGHGFGVLPSFCGVGDDAEHNEHYAQDGIRAAYGFVSCARSPEYFAVSESKRVAICASVPTTSQYR